jgi:hypothetical protein
MESAMHHANESFLIEDPQFAVDFAPNGEMMNGSVGSLLKTSKGLSWD